jgi:multidrug efflux system outer membrane protein
MRTIDVRAGGSFSRLLLLASFLAVVIAVAGCTVGPDWRKPQPDPPAAWRIEYSEAAEVANTRWWTALGDPALNQLVDTALVQNRDLLQAAARVDQLLGALRATRSQFYPQFGYSGDASYNQASRNGQPSLPPGADRDYDLYTAALGASWQIDLFGRVRRQAEAAQAQVYASEQGRRGVVLSVVTSVTTGYVTLRALDRQLEIARATANNYADTVRLFELRFKGGAVSEVEVAQAQSQYQQALAAVPSFERQVAQQENLLSVLLGRNPGDIPRGLPIEQLLEPSIPGGLPASLLERRPDILQAEQTLRAANAQIGAARALYYPTISLTGVLGLASTSLGDLVSSDSTSGSLAAGLAGPIFTFGRIEGQVMTAEAAQREALAFYQQVVLNAFREANDALVGAQKRREESVALGKRAEALRTYARLSRARYDGGVASYLEVLYAENELFGAELNATAALAQRFVELINVYKALGGGWVDLADPLGPRADAAAASPGDGPSATPAAAPARAAAMAGAAPTRPQDRTEVIMEGDSSVVNVYHALGIGGLAMRAPRSGWPPAVIVRLHDFPALESFTAAAGDDLLRCELRRPEGRAPEQVCSLNGAPADALRRAPRLYEVRLPPRLFAPTTGAVEIRWVDQWRR